jgi:hypothetical protein
MTKRLVMPPVSIPSLSEDVITLSNRCKLDLQKSPLFAALSGTQSCSRHAIEVVAKPSSRSTWIEESQNEESYEPLGSHACVGLIRRRSVGAER